MKRLAASFGLSDQGLAKVCRRHDVPRPPRGYWAKLAAGKPVQVVGPPPLRAGVVDNVLLVARPLPIAIAPAVSARIEEAAARVQEVRVLERLSQPHPVIATWNARREKEIARRQDVYDFRLRRVGRPTGFTSMERRCHRFLDAIFKSWEAQGLKVSETDRRDLMVSNGQEKIEIQARVKLQQVRRPLTEQEQRWRSESDKDYRVELEETDTLIFEVKTWLPTGLKRKWQDTRKTPIEQSAGEIVTTIVAAFPLMEEARKRREEQARLQRIAEQQRYEEQQRQKVDRDRYRRFVEHAHHWKEALLAREYLDALKAMRRSGGTDAEASALDDWMDWAEASITRRLEAAVDQVLVFQSVGQVTAYTYRD